MPADDSKQKVEDVITIHPDETVLVFLTLAGRCSKVSLMKTKTGLLLNSSGKDNREKSLKTDEHPVRLAKSKNSEENIQKQTGITEL